MLQAHEYCTNTSVSETVTDIFLYLHQTFSTIALIYLSHRSQFFLATHCTTSKNWTTAPTTWSIISVGGANDVVYLRVLSFVLLVFVEVLLSEEYFVVKDYQKCLA